MNLTAFWGGFWIAIGAATGIGCFLCAMGLWSGLLKLIWKVFNRIAVGKGAGTP